MKAMRRLLAYLTWRHWGAAVGVGLLIGVLVPLETLHLNLFWTPWKFVYHTPWYVAFACVFMLSIAAVESDAPAARPQMKQYIRAALAASMVCIALATALSDLSVFPPRREVAGSADRSTKYTHVHKRGSAVFALGFDGVVHCWIAMFIYVRLRNARLAARALARAQIDRAEANRRLLKARLDATRDRIPPDYLSQALENIERTYWENPARAEALLDDLIDFLRKAIPCLRDDEESFEPGNAGRSVTSAAAD